MTTTAAGATITGAIALTCIGASALSRGDAVHLTGDYQVDLADGSKPILGHISVSNVKRSITATTDTFPVSNAGGDVTVEARGFSVRKVQLGATVTAGQKVAIAKASGHKTIPYVGYIVTIGTPDVNVPETGAEYGIALTGGNSNDFIDVLVR